MADKGTRTPLVLQKSNRAEVRTIDTQTTDAQNAELKMRRALGLNAGGGHHAPQQRPEQARQRHRFVQDGGVPVTVLNHRTDENAGLKERIAELEASLENERTQHANTRRALSEQHAAAQALQTRLAHADLAHQEALAQERQALATAQEALAEALAAAHAPRHRAPKSTPVATPSENHASTESDAPLRVASTEQAGLPLDAEAPPRPKRGRPRSALPKEPKPVRWWTPSFRASKTKS